MNSRVWSSVLLWGVSHWALADAPGRTVDLGVPLSGVVESVAVEVGEQVKAGQELLKLDARRYRIRLQYAEAALSEVEVDLSDAQLELDRQEELYERMVTTESDLKAAKRAVARIQAQIVQRRALRDEAQLDLERTVLKAPREGVVIERGAEPGEVVSGRDHPPVLIRLGVQ